MDAFVTETVFEDSGFYLFARGEGPSGQPFTQADISSISLKVYAKDDPGTVINEIASVPVASVVFNTLQTGDSRWTRDTIGYNFRYETLAAQLPAGGKAYRFEFRLVPAAGQPFHGVFEVLALGLFGS